jgi:hypothetical protein
MGPRTRLREDAMAINDIDFDNHALQCARGAAATGSDWIETNGGIERPLRVHLRPGQYLYRFASSSTPHPFRARGCWWIEHEVIMKIVAFAREQQTTPRDAARYFLALPWSWTKVDRLVRANLNAKVDAYRGLGKPAGGNHSRDAGTRFIPPQHIGELYQLFIPGMHRAEMAAKIFTDLSDGDIWRSKPFV